MKDVYVVMMSGQGLSQPARHSVWSTKKQAMRQRDIRNKFHPDFKYYVIPQLPLRVAENWRGEPRVKFVDSVGWMEINF